MVKLNAEAIPPLRDGDRLTQREFFRRYEAAPEGTRAELLRGVVSINSRPVRYGSALDHAMPPIAGGHHAQPQSALNGWLYQYAANTNGVESFAPVTTELPYSESATEPDLTLRIRPECGGATTTDGHGYIVGPPELVGEIANTSAATDLGVKYDTYEENGVREYIVWRTALGVFDWFVLKRKKYVLLVPDPADGYLKSVAFPGLWLDPVALLDGDGRAMLAVLQKGLATAEHAAFEAKLAATAAKKSKPRKRKKP